MRKAAYKKGLAKVSEGERKNWCRRGGLSRSAHFNRRYTDNELLSIIKNFHKERGRIPTKRDLPNWDSTFRRYFGSWNNAIAAAGFKPSTVLFADKCIAKDGHRCDSFAESIIDDWLFENKIDHERHVRYPKSTFVSDFKIGSIYVEYFGLSGGSRKYDSYMQRKLAMAKENSVLLVEVYPHDLHPHLRLDEILGFLLE